MVELVSLSTLETALDAKFERYFDPLDTDPDVLAQLLNDKRSENTRRAYEKDANDFFKSMTGQPASPDAVLEFLHLDQAQAVAVTLKYKAKMVAKGLKESTINRRLAALKSLTEMGRKLGVCNFTLTDVKGERAQIYRDTKGVDAPTFSRVLQGCNRTTIAGKRDYALLLLLWSNALRRNEISQLNLSDFDPNSKTLKILGKGRGSQAETIDLNAVTVQAINDWLAVKPTPGTELFTSLAYSSKGVRLTGDGIRSVVIKYCKKAGITKQMSPHRIRHSAITAALDATDGNVRKVQKLSRHRKLDTLMIYDDNRGRDQGDISDLLITMV